MGIQWGIGLLLVFGLGGTSFAAEKTFVYCSEASPSTFNPQIGVDGATFNASSQPLYNRLVDFKTGADGITIIPSLADSWTVSKDGKIYTFKLHPGVKFHSRGDFKPTRDFTADDVVFTFMRMHDPKHPYHKVGGGTYEYYKSMALDQLIKSVTAVDKLTVKIEIAQAESPFLANLGMNFASILSAEYADHLAKKNMKEKIDVEPVGTGPFTLKSYKKDEMIRYDAFTDYFLGRPKLDKMVFAITPDPNVRFQRLKAGECHMIAEPAPQDVKSMKTMSTVQLMSEPGLNVGYLAMNVEKPPLDKKEVRLAIYHALNRTSYIDALYLGQAQLAKNPIPPTMWSYARGTPDYDYNIAKGKELMAKAGFPNGLDLELWTLPVSRPYNPAGKKMGEMMQADLAKIGIRVKLVSFDFPTYLSKARNGEHQLIQLGWTGDNGDPDNFLNVLLGCDAVKGGSNYSRWCFKPYDDLVRQARSELKQSNRVKLYEKAQAIFKAEAPWVPLVHSVVFKAMSKRVKNYAINPLGTEDFYPLDIE